ncbi:chitinase-3-like protein 1 protein [Lasius niger]|uniref:Chitinase-3-like protein 1 protein n=1 Tax=Lasius niger TaxID=67767 RepID=A0A0J7KY02_LASNI|nr:chitinase-3-like protein 1 protein [Lasius niger]
MNDIADGILGIVDLRKSLKEMHPPLQFVISIYDPAMMLRNSAMVRQEVVARIIAVIKEVDGVEMNVTAGSKERLYNFVKSLRNEMIRKSYDKRIFLALPSKPEDLAKQFDIKELVK